MPADNVYYTNRNPRNRMAWVGLATVGQPAYLPTLLFVVGVTQIYAKTIFKYETPHLGKFQRVIWVLQFTLTCLSSDIHTEVAGVVCVWCTHDTFRFKWSANKHFLRASGDEWNLGNVIGAHHILAIKQMECMQTWYEPIHTSCGQMLLLKLVKRVIKNELSWKFHNSFWNHLI